MNVDRRHRWLSGALLLTAAMAMATTRAHAQEQVRRAASPSSEGTPARTSPDAGTSALTIPNAAADAGPSTKSSAPPTAAAAKPMPPTAATAKPPTTPSPAPANSKPLVPAPAPAPAPALATDKTKPATGAPTRSHPGAQPGDEAVVKNLELLMMMEMLKDYDLFDDAD